MKSRPSFLEKIKTKQIKLQPGSPKERTQLNKIRYERGEITTENLKDTKKHKEML